MAGSKRAMNVLLKYQEFAASLGMHDVVVERVIIDPEKEGGKNG
jgi:hypothetical protein